MKIYPNVAGLILSTGLLWGASCGLAQPAQTSQPVFPAPGLFPQEPPGSRFATNLHGPFSTNGSARFRTNLPPPFVPLSPQQPLLPPQPVFPPLDPVQPPGQPPVLPPPALPPQPGPPNVPPPINLPQNPATPPR